MNQQSLIPHLFRTEFGRITSVLTRLFGIDHIGLAEDIASETFLSAMEVWPYRGVPENPTAWLYTVAKNKAKNHLSRSNNFAGKVAQEIKRSSDVSEEIEIDLSAQNITDSQLQMLFAICHPAIPAEAQIGLALRILCGFGIEEIANALLSNKETINKRLHRAKEKLRTENVKIEMPEEAEISTRLDSVLTTLYLLFNEGYYSESNDSVLREELCGEAMRLTLLLTDNQQTDLPAVNALMALMCFHASRFAARRDEDGEMILYHDQDESLWDRDLIVRGGHYMLRASQGERLTRYHVEAGIAYQHTIKEDTQEKWENILRLYNILLQIEYSPIAALNRTYALAKANGNAAAIIEAEKLNLNTNHFYYTLLGELYKDSDQNIAKQHFAKALSLAKTHTDRHTIQRKIDELG